MLTQPGDTNQALRIIHATGLPASARRERAALGLLCLAALAFYLVGLNYPIYRCDNIYYLVGAWSLAGGNGYHDISHPDAPPLLKYPPGDSATFAPFVSASGPYLKWLRLVSIVPFIAGLPLLYGLLRARVSVRGALAIVALTAFNPMTLWGLYILINAGLHSLVFLAVLVLMGRLDSHAKSDQQALLIAGGIGVLLGASFYLHRSFLCFIAATIAYLALRHQRREAAVALVIVVLMVVPWMLRSYRYSGHWISPEYESEIRGRIAADAPGRAAPFAALAHMRDNLADLPTQIGEGVFPWATTNLTQRLLRRSHLTWLPLLSDWSVVLLILIGWIAQTRRHPGLVEWYAPWHTAMMLLFFIGFGYFGLLMPWFWLYLWRGAKLLLRTLSPAPQRRAAAAGATLLLLAALARDKVYWDARGWPGDERDPRWAWVARAVPAGATVAWLGLDNYSWAPWRYFDTGRLAVGLSETQLRDELSHRQPSLHYIGLPRSNSWDTRLMQRGWKRIGQEPTGPGGPPQPQEVWTDSRQVLSQ